MKNATLDAGIGNDSATGKPHLNLQHNFTYDVVGNMLTQTDALGVAVNTTVDRRCFVTQADGPVARVNAVMSRTSPFWQKLENLKPSQYETVRFQYDKNGKPSRQDILAPGGGTYYIRHYTFDTLDALVKQELNASRAGGLPSSSFPSMITWKYWYDLNGNIALIEEPIRNSNGLDHNKWAVKSFVYDERDQLYTATSGGVTAQFSALAVNDDIVDTVDMDELEPVNASTVKSEYDANRNLISVTDPLGRASRVMYDGFDQAVAAVDPYGTVSITLHDEAGRANSSRTFALASPIRLPTNPPIPRIVQSAQDVLNAMVAAYVPTCSSLPTPGQAVVPCTPAYQLMAEARVAYDERDRPYRSDVLRMNSTTGVRLLDGPLSPGDGYVTSLVEYDAGGRVRRLVNDNNHTVTHDYDGLGRVVESVDPGGNAASSVYDERSRRTQMRQTLVDSANPDLEQVLASTLEYDARNRVEAVTDPLGHTATIAYDAAGLVSNETDPLGNSVLHYYDKQGRKVLDVVRPLAGWNATAQAAEIHIEYDYDTNGRLRRITDGLDGLTQYDLDQQGRPTRIIYGDDTDRTASYDLVGNVVQEADANGNVIDYEYDLLNRLTHRWASTLAPNMTGTRHQYFEHDALSRMVSSNDTRIDGASHIVRYAYDSLGNVLNETQDTSWIRRSFDGLGNLLELSYPDGFVARYGYDEDDRPYQVLDGFHNRLANYSYLGPAQVSSVTHGNGIHAAMTYDDGNRIQELRYEDPAGSLLVGVNYTYDAGSRIESMKLLHDVASSEIYRHDGVGRVLEMKRGTLNSTRTGIATPTSTAARAFQWSLDGANNWASLNATTQSGSYSLETRTHNDNHAVTVRNVAGQNVSLTYDANGNLVNDSKLRYQYDYLNRLSRVLNASTNEDIAWYAYDAQGRRVEKRLHQVPPLVNDTYYVYDGADVIEERDGLGTVQRHFVLAPGIDRPILMDTALPGPLSGLNSSLGRLYYVAGVDGSILGLTNSSGALVEGYEYEPYGAHRLFTPGANGVVDFGGDDVISVMGASPQRNPYAFTGRHFDAESGLHQFRTRYLLTELGRFTSRDTVGVWADKHALGNGYAYGANSPLERRDPFGTQSYSWMSCDVVCVGTKWGFDQLSGGIGSMAFDMMWGFGIGGALVFSDDRDTDIYLGVTAGVAAFVAVSFTCETGLSDPLDYECSDDDMGLGAGAWIGVTAGATIRYGGVDEAMRMITDFVDMILELANGDTQAIENRLAHVTNRALETIRNWPKTRTFKGPPSFSFSWNNAERKLNKLGDNIVQFGKDISRLAADSDKARLVAHLISETLRLAAGLKDSKLGRSVAEQYGNLGDAYNNAPGRQNCYTWDQWDDSYASSYSDERGWCTWAWADPY